MRTFWAVLLTLTLAGVLWLAVDPVRPGGDASFTPASARQEPDRPSGSGMPPPPAAIDDRAAGSASGPAAGVVAEGRSDRRDSERADSELPTLDQSLGISPTNPAEPSREQPLPMEGGGSELATTDRSPPESIASAEAVQADSATAAPGSGPAVATGHTPQTVPLEAIERVRSSAPRSTSGATTRVGRFDLPGAGTSNDPVEAPWELLVSAMEDYRPREGKTELPQWARDLSGKHVRITGFVLFPTFGTQARELLLMKNQWDGCCIGVPPTPYDAVEITLDKAVDLTDTPVNFASISGVLQVDPYLVNGWLLGLYLMENATLESIGGSGAGGF